MGSTIWCQVEDEGTQLSESPYVREFLNILFQKLSFFYLVIIGLIRFFENFKNVFFTVQNWALKFAFETQVHSVKVNNMRVVGLLTLTYFSFGPWHLSCDFIFKRIFFFLIFAGFNFVHRWAVTTLAWFCGKKRSTTHVWFTITFGNHTRTHQVDIKSLQCPLGVQGLSYLHDGARRAEFMDGMMDWWMRWGSVP